MIQPDPLHRDGIPFDGGAFFQHVLERASSGLWRLPEGNPATVQGPMVRDSEACLPGLCEPGDAIWFDPAVRPFHGALVVVQWSEWVYQRIAEHHVRNGLQAPSRAAVKLLRNPDLSMVPAGLDMAAHAAEWRTTWPDWLLVQSAGMMLLGDNIIPASNPFFADLECSLGTFARTDATYTDNTTYWDWEWSSAGTFPGSGTETVTLLT